MNGWIGVDLDGTLAEYHEWKGPLHIGAPIPEMVARVKAWLAEGREVKIFTARVKSDAAQDLLCGAAGLAHDVTVETIREWSLKVLGRYLPITCEKDYAMIELYDDRCVQVEMNTGRLIGRSTRGL